MHLYVEQNLFVEKGYVSKESLKGELPIGY